MKLWKSTRKMKKTMHKRTKISSPTAGTEHILVVTEQQLLDMLSDNEVKYVLNIKCIRVRYYECVLNGYR